MTARIIVPLEITDSNLIEGGTSIPEDDAPIWDVGTTYANGDEVIYEHVLYTSVTDGNTGNTPDPNLTTPWLPGLATNRWKVFDGFLQDAASAADSASWQIQTTDFINGVALFGVEAATVRVVLDNPDDGVVYDETFDLVDESRIVDYDQWFFLPQERFSDFAVTDLPPYPGDVTITVSDPGNTVRLGQLALGQEIDLGVTVNGLDLNIELFSSKTPDVFGRISAVKRGSADLFEPLIKVPTARVTYLRRILKQREAIPTVYVFDGPSRANEYLAFGDFEDLRLRSRFGQVSDMQISIREYV